MAALPPVALLDAYRRWRLGEAPAPDARPMFEAVLQSVLGLGNRQLLNFLFNARPDFATFCDWIVATAGVPDPVLLARYHQWLARSVPDGAAAAALDAVMALPAPLDEAALAHWDRDGFTVLKQAIDADTLAGLRELVWETIEAHPDDPVSWTARDSAYTSGIMIELFQHPLLDAARRSPRIQRAFAQLWGTPDLWVTIDRLGFNPPETMQYHFRGSPLHWDVSLARPIPFGTQAILYLTDTAADQGAFRVVPGFHQRIDCWLDAIGDADPRAVDLSAGAECIAGDAGDLIIWRQDIPHGASPNRAATPRLAQYLNYFSADQDVQPDWR